MSADTSQGSASTSSSSSSKTITQDPSPTTSGQSWSLPPTLKSRPVYPDRYTSPEVLQNNLIGRESEPGLMSIYLCLLDGRPHLHPSLGALHKHRLHAHSVPLPLDPTSDPPLGSGAKPEWLEWKYSDEEEARRKAFLPLS